MSDDIKTVLEAEAQRFEKERDVDASEYVRARPVKDPGQVYSVRIPVSRLEQLRRVAMREAKQPSALLREWALERLADELRRTPDLEHADRLTVAEASENYRIASKLVEDVIAKAIAPIREQLEAAVLAALAEADFYKSTGRKRPRRRVPSRG